MAEFWKDVCSFANTEGGYLIIGIREDKGKPQEIIGIDISNDDQR
ncbi:MAG TPA: ATP-binding protein [Clostridiales bacterium]|jgi:predicted HTH transcriptional regulator|nr:ATP-binding protein [Clostridiales bacterium]